MPRGQPEAVTALQKLGQRVRAVFAKQLPICQPGFETMRITVRAQYYQEQTAKRISNAHQGTEQTPIPQALRAGHRAVIPLDYSAKTRYHYRHDNDHRN